MLQSETLLAMRPSANTTAASEGGLIDPDGLINVSETASTSFGAGLATDALGLVGTAQKFRAQVVAQVDPSSPIVRARVILRVPWTLTAQSAGAPTRGTIRASLLIDNVVIVGGDGAPRDLSAANGTPYVELIDLVMPANMTFAAGTVVSVQVQPKITTVSGVPGSTFQPTLRHDPTQIDDQLVVEFQGAKGVV